MKGLVLTALLIPLTGCGMLLRPALSPERLIEASGPNGAGAVCVTAEIPSIGGIGVGVWFREPPTVTIKVKPDCSIEVSPAPPPAAARTRP